MIELKTMLGKTIQLPKEQVSFRPSVYGVVIREGKLLVVKTKSTGQYFFPGGGVEIDETIEQSLKREFKEELGINIDIDELANFEENFFYYEPTKEAMHALLFFFLCHTNDEINPNYKPPIEEVMFWGQNSKHVKTFLKIEKIFLGLSIKEMRMVAAKLPGLAGVGAKK